MSLLTGLALRRRSVTLLLVVVIIFAGAYTWASLPAELFPPVEVTTVRVVTFWPGNKPSKVLEDVTEPIEDAIMGMSGLEDVESTSFDNRSVVLANFEFGTDMDEAESDIISAVSGIDFPDGVEEPKVERIDPLEQPVIQVSVLSSTDHPIPELQRIVDDLVLPEIEQVDGAFNVDLIGEVDDQVVIEVDVNKLEDLGPTLAQVARAISDNNMSLPAGDINERGTSFVVETTHEFGSVEEITNLVIGFERVVTPSVAAVASSFPARVDGEKREVRLRDIAEIRVGTSEAQGISRTNGRPSLTIAVVKEEDANTVDVTAGVLEALVRAQENLTPDIEFITISNDSPDILDQIRSLGMQGAQGFFLPMGMPVSFTLLSSTLVALTVVPVLGSLLLRPGDISGGAFGGESGGGGRDTLLQRIYTPMVRRALRYKALTIAGAVALVVGAMFLLRLVPITMFPPSAPSFI